MAEVYLAKTRGLGGFEKLVALKMIHPRYSEDEHFVQMLVEEAKISVQLNHVNVAQTFDLGCIEDTYFITMELIEGADAYRVMRRASELNVKIPIETAMFVAAEVCAGIDYAHRKRDAEGKPLGIIHRDISPQNILISFTGEVKVVDFGIAKAALRSQETEAGVIKGKYYYMSPEQAWGDPVDQRTDIFSTGVILYELLSGQMLYLEDNISLLLDRVRKAEIDPPTTKRADVPQDLSEIAMKALAKYPEERYPTAAAMGQALTRLLYRIAPDYTPTRLAQLMGWLFEPELKRSTQGGAQPSGEHVLPGSTKDGPPPGARPLKSGDYAPAPVSVIFRNAAVVPNADRRPDPPRPKGGRQLPANLDAGSGRPPPPRPNIRNRDPGLPTAPLPLPTGPVAPRGPAEAVQTARPPALQAARPSAAEPMLSESGERRRAADQPTAMLAVKPDEPLAPRPKGRLEQLPSLDSVPDGGDDAERTEVWDNETLVDDEGKFDHVIEELRARSRAQAAAAASSEESLDPPTRKDGRPIDPSNVLDLDDPFAAQIQQLDESVTLTGDLPSPFRDSRRAPPSVTIDPGVPPEAEAATRGHSLAEAAASVERSAQASAARSSPVPPSPPAAPVVAKPAPARVPGPSWPPPAIPAKPAPAAEPGRRNSHDPFAFAPTMHAVPGTSSVFDPFAPAPLPSAVATAGYQASPPSTLRRWLFALIALIGGALLVTIVLLLAAPDAPPPSVEIVSVPAGAAVTLDGHAVGGATPLTIERGLTTGHTHRVEVRIPGYAVWVTSLVASPGLVKQIAILSPMRGSVRVESQPAGAQVFVDGSYRGSTPLVLAELEATHEFSIRISKQGFREENRTVRLGDHLDQQLQVQLAPVQ